MTPLEMAAQKPVSVLIPYLGYGEKNSNSGLDRMDTYGHNNYTFIAQYFDNLRSKGILFYNGRKQAAEWCDMTNDWAHCQCWGPEMAMKVLYQPAESCGAGCYWSARYFRENGAWIDRSGTPRTGDQIFFGPKYDETHTGIVEKVDSKYVYTIEGNTSDKLMRKSYLRTDTKIAGYGRPHYELVAYLFENKPENKKEEPDVTEDVVKKIVENKLKGLAKPTRDETLKTIGDKFIKNFDELPEWAKPVMRILLDKGYIDGGTDIETDADDINMFLSDIKTAIVAYRIFNDVNHEKDGM